MKILAKYLLIILIAVFSFLPVQDSNSGALSNAVYYFNDTDTTQLPAGGIFEGLIYFFDLRDRETFIQLTYPDALNFGASATAHIQIFDVSNNCNENDFFDVYTINDTHTYNMRDIQTNDGNPSGVVLPAGSYGIVAISLQIPSVFPDNSGFAGAFGNMRILDNNGYEYRTNAQSLGGQVAQSTDASDPEYIYSFNFNNEGGVTLSDIVGITLVPFPLVEGTDITEWAATDVANIYTPLDIDIYDLNEVPFSCRDIIFSCVDEDNPRLEELLETAQVASVASFEYGINDAIPHSKDGELLCPGNIISDGIVNLRVEGWPQSVFDANTDALFNIPIFYGYVGLNNGNKRGSFDSIWITNENAPIADGN